MKTPFHALPLAALLASAAVTAQTPVHIQVNDPRPVMAGVDSLEQALHVPTNYEDPRFVYPADIEDVTGKVQNAQQRAAHPNVRIIVPKGGPLEMSGAAPAKPEAADAMSLATLLCARHEALGYPGRFSVTDVGGMATVEPAAARSIDGTWTAAIPAMRSRITIPYADRSAAESLDLIAKALSQSLGIQVGVGQLPMVAFVNAHSTFGANDEPANAVLVRLFYQVSAFYGTTALPSQPLYSYRLLYDPGVKYYFLHVGAVAPFTAPISSQAPTPPPPKGFLLRQPPHQP